MAEHDDAESPEIAQTESTFEWVDVQGADWVLLRYDPGFRGSTRAVVLMGGDEAIGSFTADHFDKHQRHVIAGIIRRVYDAAFLHGTRAGEKEKAKQICDALNIEN